MANPASQTVLDKLRATTVPAEPLRIWRKAGRRYVVLAVAADKLYVSAHTTLLEAQHATALAPDSSLILKLHSDLTLTEVQKEMKP